MPTAEQIIRAHILTECATDGNDWGYEWPELPINPAEAKTLWDDVSENSKHGRDWLWETLDEFRNSGARADAWDHFSSRHYEHYSCALKIGGIWVGWVYWYGGGKHGNPEEIDWIEDAVILDLVSETEVTTIKRVFAVQPKPAD